MYRPAIIRKIIPSGIRRFIKELIGITSLQEHVAALQERCDQLDEWQGGRSRLSNPAQSSEEKRDALVSGIKQKWGKIAAERQDLVITDWLDSPVIARHYVHRYFWGKSTTKNWFIWTKETWLPNKVDRLLNLGCGDGCLERHAYNLGMAKIYDAVDISDGAIEIAMQNATAEGIHDINYSAQDLNYPKIEQNKYDAIFMAMSLHHIENLEALFSEVRNGLKDNGLFIINEYVGPSRLQRTRKQIFLANLLLNLLPMHKRKDVMSGEIKWRVHTFNAEQMKEADPSEAVRSAEIIPLMRKHFNVIAQVNYGGTIMFPLMSMIAGNFEDDKFVNSAIITIIGSLERLLIRSRLIPSDFAVLVANNKGR